MSNLIISEVEVKENSVEPVSPTYDNGFIGRIGSQSFVIEIVLVASGAPIFSKSDVFDFIVEKIGTIGGFAHINEIVSP